MCRNRSEHSGFLTLRSAVVKAADDTPWTDVSFELFSGTL